MQNMKPIHSITGTKLKPSHCFALSLSAVWIFCIVFCGWGITVVLLCKIFDSLDFCGKQKYLPLSYAFVTDGCWNDGMGICKEHRLDDGRGIKEQAEIAHKTGIYFLTAVILVLR